MEIALPFEIALSRPEQFLQNIVRHVIQGGERTIMARHYAA